MSVSSNIRDYEHPIKAFLGIKFEAFLSELCTGLKDTLFLQNQLCDNEGSDPA